MASELRVLGANALLGGVSAGVVALIRGESPADAFLKGAGGGALVYTGKRIVVRPWFGAGLVGRQVGLLGNSMVSNGGAGRGAFERLTFGFGPVRAYIGGEDDAIRWGVDLPAVAATLWGIAGTDWSLDLSQTLSSGVVVFQGDGGVAFPGMFVYDRDSRSHRRDYERAHERVHILQYDQSYFALGQPVEGWLARRLPRIGTPFDLEFNLVSLGAAVALTVGFWQNDHDAQLWEREAIYLGRTR